jgi:hypothetical protein
MSLTFLPPVPGTWDDPIVDHDFTPFAGASVRKLCRVCKRAPSRHGDLARHQRDVRNRVIVLADQVLKEAGQPLSSSDVTRLMLETKEGKYLIDERGTVHENPSQFIGWALAGWTETEPRDPVKSQDGPHRFGVPRDAVHIVRVANRGTERMYAYAPPVALSDRVARLEDLVDELRAQLARLNA